MSSPEIYFKIIGPRRCGTNYMEWLIQNNFRDCIVMRHDLWHKHRNPYEAYNDFDFRNEFDGGKLIYPMVLKNPYSFYHSFQKDYHDEKFAEYNYDAIEEQYNQKVRGIIKFHKSHFFSHCFIYENLLTQTKNELETLALSYSIDDRLMDNISDQPNRMNKQGEPQEKQFDPTFYTNRRYMNLIPDEYLKRITNDVDDMIFEYFGFDKYA